MSALGPIPCAHNRVSGSSFSGDRLSENLKAVSRLTISPISSHNLADFVAQTRRLCQLGNDLPSSRSLFPVEKRVAGIESAAISLSFQ